ncbi:MAG: CorA family divalent cation transporter, partial [Promethearchaeota archaeon]
MLQIFAVQNGEFRRLARIQEITEQRDAGDFVWIAAQKLSIEEQTTISQYLSVEPKSLAKILERPPSGRYHRYFDFSALHTPICVAEPLLHDEPFIILLSDYIVVTIGSHLPQESIGEVEGTLRNLVETGYKITPSTVAVRIVQEIVEQNATIIREMISQALELGKSYAKVDITELLAEITRLRQLHGELYHRIMEQRSL